MSSTCCSCCLIHLTNEFTSDFTTNDHLTVFRTKRKTAKEATVTVATTVTRTAAAGVAVMSAAETVTVVVAAAETVAVVVAAAASGTQKLLLTYVFRVRCDVVTVALVTHTAVCFQDRNVNLYCTVQGHLLTKTAKVQRLLLQGANPNYMDAVRTWLGWRFVLSPSTDSPFTCLSCRRHV